MSLSVSLCILRIEICDSESNSGKLEAAMATDKDKIKTVRGRRQVRDITVETYASSVENTKQLGLIPQIKDDKSSESSQISGPSEPSEGENKNQVSFVSGNPFVEVTKGILHLFKENELTTMEKAAQCSQTVCILAVPATVTCHDLLTFVAACQEDISHLRIIRDGSPNQYMALLKFRSQRAASEFYESFNGVPYNSLEPDTCCHLVFVSHVELIHECAGAGIPPLNHTELPTCPVCLERMDESVDGILTILCNHTFHSSCLNKWGDTTCPVCRYTQTPEMTADNKCLECHSAESLWICLICGHVGCGRYVHGHAYQHYIQTQHCYSMQLGNNRVWDYVGDNFVHRLLQNKGDGKLVEGSTPSKDDSEEKLDSVQLEFTYLLTSQLESQRLFFEEKMTRLEQESITETADLKLKAIKAVEENEILKGKITGLTHEKQGLEKKLHNMHNRLTTTLSELQDEKQMCRALQDNQSVWQSKFSALENKFEEYKNDKEKELADMKEQLRDLMFYLEAQKEISKSENREEIEEGKIVIGEASQNPSQKKTRRRRNR